MFLRRTLTSRQLRIVEDHLQHRGLLGEVACHLMGSSQWRARSIHPEQNQSMMCVQLFTYIMCKHGYVCIYIYTCILYIHAYMHTYIHTYIHTYMHTYMCKCVRACECLDKYDCTPAYLLFLLYIYMHMYTHVIVQEHIRMHTYLSTPLHTCRHVNISECIHIHM